MLLPLSGTVNLQKCLTHSFRNYSLLDGNAQARLPDPLTTIWSYVGEFMCIYQSSTKGCISIPLPRTPVNLSYFLSPVMSQLHTLSPFSFEEFWVEQSKKKKKKETDWQNKQKCTIKQYSDLGTFLLPMKERSLCQKPELLCFFKIKITVTTKLWAHEH